MDAGKYYALLRFEEASTALRVALKLDVVGAIGDKTLSLTELGDLWGFTEQGARTFAALLEVMEVLQVAQGMYSVAERARVTLAKNLPTSRQPYLKMGADDQVDVLIEMLSGRFASESIPLYARETTAETLMDQPDVAREIAFGLAARAKNFAEPLAKTLVPLSNKARIMADIGAGSPYVANACLEAIPHLEKIYLVDRPNSMKYAKEMLDGENRKLHFLEQDFFQEVPAADIYCLSNTAHDWLKNEYVEIMTNIRDSIAPGGIVCIHEPLLLSTWNSAAEWVHALWMACYALTLYKLTQGKGTCYSKEEHDQVMAHCHFVPTSKPVETRDGCTALLYRREGDAEPERGPVTQTRTQTN